MKSCLHGLKRDHTLTGELIFVRSSVKGSPLIVAPCRTVIVSAFSIPVYDVDGLVLLFQGMFADLVPGSAAYAIPGRAETLCVQQLLVE